MKYSEQEDFFILYFQKYRIKTFFSLFIFVKKNINKEKNVANFVTTCSQGNRWFFSSFHIFVNHRVSQKYMSLKAKPIKIVCDYKATYLSLSMFTAHKEISIASWTLWLYLSSTLPFPWYAAVVLKKTFFLLLLSIPICIMYIIKWVLILNIFLI